MKNIIKEYFLNLGLDERQFDIFMILSRQGGRTILQLSRVSNIPRTGVYRVIDELIDLGLVYESNKKNTNYYFASDISTLKQLVRDQQNKTKFLNEYFDDVSKELLGRVDFDYSGTHINMYKGVESSKKIISDVFSSDSKIRGYGIDLELIFSQFIKNNIDNHRVNLELLIQKSKTEIDLLNDLEKFIKIKQIDKSVLNIEQNYFLYDDEILILYVHKKELVCINIQNSKTAQLQKQLFDLAWKTSLAI